MIKLEKLLEDMIGRGAENARRLPGGLGLRYTPPNAGDLPPIHVLSLSRRDHVDPSNTELKTVHQALARVRPAAGLAMITRSSNGDMMIRRISWREDVGHESTEEKEQANA